MVAGPFSEKVVAITGASSGIGKALALRLAGQGAWLALAARDAQRLDALALECQQLGGRALAVPTDVTDEARCRAMIERTLEAYGRLDILINDAGMAVVCKLEEMADLHLFKQVMDVNFNGMLYCTYHALPHLKQTQGRIVNISSLGGLMALPYNTAYIASKHAMNGFSDALRMELKPAGVSVTVICPSWVATEFHERYLNKDGQPKGPAGRAVYTKRTMSADECARITLIAAWMRKRQVLMPPGGVGLWLKLIAPGLLETITLRMFLAPAARRVRAQKQD